MPRALFTFDPAFRAPRGGPIIDLQRGLAQAGDFPLSVDGIFASQTVAAVKLWQTKAGMTASGAVDDLSSLGLTHTNKPSLFRRCLALTAAYEGQGYTLAVGNFDGAGVTWGIIGFTLLTGDLAKVIKLIEARSPGLLATSFGDNVTELLHILDASKADKTIWANSISTGPKKVGLRTDWRDGFETLGNQVAARAAQDELAHDDYWRIAVRDIGLYGKLTELDAAIFFDTAVQSGGVNDEKGAAVSASLHTLPGGAGDRERLRAIAEALTTGVHPAYVGDVRARRMSIAAGMGKVHGATYKISNWALDTIEIDDIWVEAIRSGMNHGRLARRSFAIDHQNEDT